MDGQNSTRKTAGQSLNTRLLAKLAPENLRLPSDDTRKVKHLCRQRRAVLMELKTAADSDGGHVELAARTIATALDMARSCVFERLDDLKKLGLLIDEERLGFNKPRRRRLDLVRAQELLGVVCSGERPKGLPDCVPTELWNRLVATLDAACALPACGEAPVYGDTRDETIESLVAGLRHHGLHRFQDREWGEHYILELIRHAIAIENIPLEWWQFTQYDCDVEGCPCTIVRPAEVA